jgi:hypothetical protein
MDTLSITFTGRLHSNPREIRTGNGTGVSLWIEVPLGNERSSYFEVTAWGTLASHVLASVHQNDRVTVRGINVWAKAWLPETGEGNKKEPRSCVAVRASDISVSLAHDSLTTGHASRQAAAASDLQVGLPAAAQADLKVLAGVTAPAA